MRAACVTMLTEYAADVGIKLNVYRSRQKEIRPPNAFVDDMGETSDNSTNLPRYTPVAEIVVVHGIYDYGETVDQRDAFVDGFRPWVQARVHAGGANRLIALAAMDDLPDWEASWLDDGRVYYATRIRLEGYGLS
jgi:hypothetical protein